MASDHREPPSHGEHRRGALRDGQGGPVLLLRRTPAAGAGPSGVRDLEDLHGAARSIRRHPGSATREPGTSGTFLSRSPSETGTRSSSSRVRFLAGSSYDLAWLSSATSYQWLGRPRLGPTVVDICDLADVKERQRADLIGKRRAHDAAARLRRAAAVAQARINAADWSSFQRSVASEVDRVVLASETDVPLLGVESCNVVPNTYERPDRPAGHDVPRRLRPHTPPSGNFRLTRRTSTEPAGWWRSRRLPSGRSSRSFGCRIVGKTTGSVDALGEPPLVTVVGKVPRMEPELGGADLVVVPLRMGSGTRLKILEAFAHRVPVDVDAARRRRPGWQSTASACFGRSNHVVRRGLREALQRSRLPPSARRRSPGMFEERYESKRARDRIRQVVGSVTTSGQSHQRQLARRPEDDPIELPGQRLE